MQLLLVEDDASLASGLKTALGAAGFTVNHVDTGRAAVAALSTQTPDMVVLDLGLPDMDGMDVLKKLRIKNKELPVLILTARAELDDKILGLEQGADDYLPKPFDMPELIARLHVFERRLSTTKTRQMVIGDVSLDASTMQVKKGEEDIVFPRREFMVLKSLMELAGKILTREQLENKLYEWGEEVSSNAVEVHIHHLRKKLGSDFIKTVRGVGYTIKPAG